MDELVPMYILKENLVNVGAKESYHYTLKPSIFDLRISLHFPKKSEFVTMPSSTYD